MRAKMEELLWDTCTIIQPPAMAMETASGGVSRTPAETSNVPCRLGPQGTLRPEEKVIADKLSLKQPAVVTFKWDRVVSVQAQIRFGSGSTAETYEVRGFVPRRNLRLSLRVICERVR